MKKVIKSKEQLGKEIEAEKLRNEVNEVVRKIKYYFHCNYNAIELIIDEKENNFDIKFKDYYQILSDRDYDAIKEICGKFLKEFYWGSSFQHIYVSK